MEAEKPSAGVKRKRNDRVLQLSEHRRGLLYNVVAQYGPPDDMRYVVNVVCDDEIFQGIGPSKKRAKAMAAEQVLVRLSVLSASDVDKPEAEVLHPDDMTADVFQHCDVFYNFHEDDEPVANVVQQKPIVPLMAVNTDVKPLMAIDTGVEEDEYDPYHMYVGRNSLSILSELEPDANASWRLVYENKDRSKAPKFVMTVMVGGMVYRGEASSKKLAKGRAARDALMDHHNIQFQATEDGMPVYQGSERVWEQYKAKLEKESYKLVGSFTHKNPVAQLHELFTEIEYDYPAERDERSGFFQCKVKVKDRWYEGIGMNKKEAKANASSNALDALHESGELDARVNELNAKKKGKEEKLRLEPFTNSANPVNRLEHWFRLGASAAGPKNAVSKLNELFPGVEYAVVGEMPMRNTCLTAFATSVRVNNRTFIGIGKNKKLSKMDAAEKALRGLRLWTAEDEQMKQYALRGDSAMPTSLNSLQVEDQFAVTGSAKRGAFGSFRGGIFRGGPVRGTGSAVRGSASSSGLGFGGGFDNEYGGQYSGFEDWEGQDWADEGQGAEDEYWGEDVGGVDEEEMLVKLSTVIARLLEANPKLGAEDVWKKLQAEESVQNYNDPWQYGGSYAEGIGRGRCQTPRGFGSPRGSPGRGALSVSRGPRSGAPGGFGRGNANNFSRQGAGECFGGANWTGENNNAGYSPGRGYGYVGPQQQSARHSAAYARGGRGVRGYPAVPSLLRGGGNW